MNGRKLSIFSKILVAILAIQFLCILIIGGNLLFNATNNAQNAFDSGRFIKIDVNTGQIEGNIITTNNSPTKSDDDDKAKLSDEQYRLKRIKELTGEGLADDGLESDGLNDEKLGDAKLGDEGLGDNKLGEIKSNDESIAKNTPPQIISATQAQPAPRIIQTPLKLDIPAELMRKQGKYLLPTPSKNNEIIPWKYYAKPIMASDKKPISIIITNLGLNDKITQQAMQLDENITLAFSPYAPNLAMQIAQARQNGFEAWLNLPLQHENYPIHDYGNLTILNELSLPENIKLLHQTLNNTNGVVGLIALPDEKYSASSQMLELFAEIKSLGLLLSLYSTTFTPDATNANLLTHIEPHINGGNIPADLNQLFAGIEAKAKTVKHLNISISAMPAVMQAMNSWIAQLPAKNIILTPLSSAHANQLQ